MRKRSFSLVLMILLIISLSCNFITGQAPGNEPTPGPSSGPTVESPVAPLSATGNGPSGLTAEATSADSVKLSWKSVDGAKSYHILVSTNGSKALPMIELAPSVTSYEDFLATPGSQLTYAVESVGESGSIGQSITNVITSARQPNPLTVQVQIDNKKSSSAKIGPEGGSISVTAA